MDSDRNEFLYKKCYNKIMQIIPAINAKTFEEVKGKISKVKEFLPEGSWIHIDVADGKFSPNKIWGNPEELKALIKSDSALQKLNFEIHLMIINPELAIGGWVGAGAKRIIAHEEALSDPEVIKDQCAIKDCEAMIAINPETPVENLEKYFDDFKYFQILAVKPGWAGQKFDERVINKIKSLKDKNKNAKIEIDGGLNPETARAAKDAGADIFVSASYILSGDDLARNYQNLSEAVQK